MKIALLGSAPSSVALAPFADQSWKIWGCSPGLYSQCPRVDAWFELHRWEPPVIGQPGQQKPWFSPEYVAWMGMLKCPVWMFAKVPEIPTSEAYPVAVMIERFGNYFMTSSLSWMFALAIDQILKERQQADKDGQPHPASEIGLWGVDMSATEEYGYQRAGCQYFIQMANNLGIQIVVPAESDLLQPMPLYGISESSPFMIKATARMRELTARQAQHTQQAEYHKNQSLFLQGAIDNLNYMINTWHQDGEPVGTHVGIWALSPFLNKTTE